MTINPVGDQSSGLFVETPDDFSTGVFARSLATTGSGRGVVGITHGASGYGVEGWATANPGTGIGVRGRSSGNDGVGVFGSATASAITATTVGVRGEAASSNGIGVQGIAGLSTGSGVSFGVRGESPRPNGRGVEGQVTSTTGITFGVRGLSESNSGTGVYGWATATSGTTYGVYGRVSSPDGFAGYFLGRSFLSNRVGIGTTSPDQMLHVVGNATVTGSLSKGGGSFKIDHPLDPKNKYLYHSFVESPDMMNIYNGNVVTDQSGSAEVELPDYFDSLNKDFRYQLTVIGAFAQAIVAEEIKDNRFLIATDVPGIKVSWQVTGIRDDAWARANRIEVEVPKAEHERGQYLHPEAFGVEQEESETAIE